jgi:ApaG protein
MLQRLIRLYFEANRGLEDNHEITKAVDKAFEGLKLCAEFERVRTGCFSVTTTGPLRVEVYTQFKPELMRDENFAFQYTVRVEHTGIGSSEPVQLVGRHWLFVDAENNTFEVPKHAPGIVGHHPILEAGQCFEYSSGTTLSTHRGQMSGSLKVVQVSGNEENLDGELDVDGVRKCVCVCV